MRTFRTVLLTTLAPTALLTSGVAVAQTDGAEAQGEIIVTGSRIARDGFEAPTPTVVLNSDQIAARGLANVGDLLNEIPQFRNSQSNQTAVQSTFGTGATFADIRALGGIRTLTLVDGRRHVPSAATGQVDLNLIPTLLVDRVDVVTGGASAAYGSDAISGVVNVVLNKRLTGFRGDFSVGMTQYGDNLEQRGAIAYGAPLGDRGHIVAGVDYMKSDGVESVFDRDWGRAQPGLVSYVGARGSNPSRFYDTGVQFINMAYGGLITGVNADTTASNGVDVLRGISFGPGGVRQAFNYGNAIGTLATDFSGGDSGLFPQDGFPLVTPVERIASFAHLDYELTDSLSVFVEGGVARSGTKNQSPPVRSQSGLTIRRDNAFLPDWLGTIMDANGITSFGLGRPFNDFGPVATDNENTTYRIVAGFDLDLGASWTLNGYYQYGRNDFSSRVSNLRIESNFTNAVDSIIVNGVARCRSATAVAAGCLPLNVFGEGAVSTVSGAIDYVTGTIAYDITTTQQVGALSVQGEPFSTWAGPVSVAFGGEYREEEAVATSDAISQANGFNYSNPKPFAGRYDVKEAFGEVIVPLAKDVAFAQSLELNGAVRLTDYSSTGSVTTWKVGATWAPIEDILFRATRSRDIRAPNNSELYQQSSTRSQLRNPFSGATGQISTLNLASATLKPEIARTWTGGVVLRPGFLPGFTASLDYWDIQIDGAISSFPAQTVLDNCFAEVTAGAAGTFCGFVSRTGTGSATTINEVSVQLLNIASLKARGFDFEAAYRFPLAGGTLNARLFGTYTIDLISDDGLGIARTFNSAGVLQTQGSVIDRAGQVGGFTNGLQNGATSTPSWVLNGSLGYAFGKVSGAIQGRYVGGGRLDNTLVGPDSPDYDPASPISIADNTVDARFYLSASVQVDVFDDGTRKLQLYAVGNNLTNVDPPFPWVALAGMYDRAGRSFKVGARVAF